MRTLPATVNNTAKKPRAAAPRQSAGTSQPWYKQSKVILPVFLLVLAAVAYAVIFPRDKTETPEPSPSPEYSYSATSRPSIRGASGAELIQLRPMAYTGAGAGSGGLASRTYTPVAASAAEVDALQNTMEKNGKIILPENVAGNCNIAPPGLKDLSSCLARNGGHAE